MFRGCRQRIPEVSNFIAFRDIFSTIAFPPERYARLRAANTRLRLASASVALAAVLFLLVSFDPYFERFDPMGMWLARLAGALLAGAGAAFEAFGVNCPACGRPLSLGIVAQAPLNEAVTPRYHGRGRIRYKPCEVESRAAEPGRR